MANNGMKIPELNINVGFHLLKFLDGTDASNFLEVANGSSQFSSIVTTSDAMFQEIMETFRDQSRVLLDSKLYGHYLQDCEVLDDKLVPFVNRNPGFTQPVQRLFVHPCFCIEGFSALCKAYRTPLFQYYCRILSFNTDLYCADFGLVDYELYCETVSVERDLNVYEKKFLKSKIY